MTTAGGAGAHEASYEPLGASGTPGRFACRVTCTGCDFSRVSTSKVGAPQARANARSAYTRHLREVPETVVEPAGAAEVVVEEPGPAPTPAPTPAPVPIPAHPRSLEVTSRAVGRARWALVPLLVVAGVLATLLVVDAGGDEAVAPGTAVTGGAPATPTPTIETPTTPSEFVTGLRTLDPVFDGYDASLLRESGETICSYYATGQDVVQIIAITTAGGLTPHQSATLVRLASPVFCPQFVKPMTEELDGLG